MRNLIIGSTITLVVVIALCVLQSGWLLDHNLIDMHRTDRLWR